ncbi:hypothetical protein RvY_07449-1 [Ramazzottius varieornatus]|uniref:Nitrate/nitrite sensing protein domain-containing protein n=1 Tax=Ramazzottius varieornatus TaxID=947166 RepID=A0A1D1V287_RAMVA|nr:hypothetical protein RvY_07449-1 [Ramazzottius varieornatus]
MPDGMENEFRNFSKDNSATHRARVVRLLVIFAVPMIVVFVECGLIITKAVRSQQLVAETNSGIMAALQIGSLVTSLQKERGMTSIYLTSLSPIAWERVLKFRNNTDLAFEHVTKWRGGPQDDKHFATGEDFRNFLLDYRRTINSTTQSLSELRWYTAAITILIKWVNRDIYMGGDNGGDLWRYFVAYELILQAKDTIGLQRALGGNYYARGYHTSEEQLWFNEAEVQARVLLDAAFLHSARTKDLYQSLLDHYSEPVIDIRKSAKLFRNVRSVDNSSLIVDRGNGTDLTNGKNNVTDQAKAQSWFANMTVLMDDVIGPTELDLTTFILLHLDEQSCARYSVPGMSTP